MSNSTTQEEHIMKTEQIKPRQFKSPFSFTEEDTTSLSSYDKISDEVERQCKCSWKTRIIGYAVCCIFGWMISLVSSLTFMFRHDSTEFAIYYSIGQILNISGSCFLSGPIDQLKNMGKETRIVLSLLYVGSTILTLVLAFALPQNLKGLTFLSMIIQMVSYFFYTFSYLPFGRHIIRGFFRTTLE